LAEQDLLPEIREAYDYSAATGALDTFVFAYRLDSRILQTLATDDHLRAALESILVNADDTKRGRSIGLALGTISDPAPAGKLTKRESEVFALLAEGRTNREIAQVLFISEVTAKVHVRNVLRKLGVRNRTEAALQALRMQQRIADEENGASAD
jgi:DNA-binding NarL/FixJ family response regulator